MKRTIILTGASGYVGARLYYDLSNAHFNVLGTYNSHSSEHFSHLDITDAKKVKELVRTEKPDVIVHNAALASSKECNNDKQKAIDVNDKGTKNIVEAANTIGSGVIYISGTVAERPGEDNMYEQTKSSGELIVKGTLGGHITLRPSVIFGMSPNTMTDKPFNQILKDIEGRGKLSYDDSWRFQPTWIGHISEIIIAIMENGILVPNRQTPELPVVVQQMSTKFQIASDILSTFGRHPTISEERSSREPTEYNLDVLGNLGLPMHTYSDMIAKITDEIKHREDYIIR